MTRFLITAATCLSALALLPASSSGHSDGRNGRIAWSRLTADFRQAQIVTANPDGSHLRVLTQPPEGASDLDPKWSPDGTRILFARESGDNVEIVVMNADGRSQHVVSFGCTDPCVSDQAPTWAPDGHHIAFTRRVGPIVNGGARSLALWIGRDDGTHVRRLSPLDIDPIYEDAGANWSRDRSYIQFLRLRADPLDDTHVQAAVFRMRPDGTSDRQLTPWEINADETDLSQAARGPTKDLVVFETNSHEPKAQNIATVPATCPTLAICTRQIRYLTANPSDSATTSFNPAWAPDGSRIAFAEATFPPPGDTSTDWYADIYTVDPDGRDRRLVSPGAEWNFRPDWGVRPRAWPFDKP
jgi:Tol biopolymer transport system component